MPTPSLSKQLTHTLHYIGYFEPQPCIAVAVSGGGDSLALLLLMKQWADACGGTIIALSVNHGLREEAADECQYVAKICAARGITHHTLTPNKPPPHANIQAWARNLRYHAMCDFCHQQHILHLCVAHHADDQAETYHLRKQRGAVGGLAAMASESDWAGVRLLRPLLNIPKAHLQAYLAAEQITALEDPSNQDMRYDRVKIRQNLPFLPPNALTDAANTRQADEQTLAQFIAQHVQLSPFGYAHIASDALKTHKDHLLTHLLIRTLTTVRGLEAIPRFNDAARLRLALQAGAFKHTLHGCMISQQHNGLLIMREPGRLPNPMPYMTNMRWDGRFTIQHPNAMPHMLVAPLPLSTDAFPLIPKSVHQTLPAIWDEHLETPLFIPHMNAHSFCFSPAKALAGLPWGCYV